MERRWLRSCDIRCEFELDASVLEANANRDHGVVPDDLN
jgi:hypothetical protein